MRVAVVINRSSGTALEGDDDLEDRVLRPLRERLGQGAVELVPEAEGEALPARLARAMASGPDLLVVGGGDGTIACAAKAVLGRSGVGLGVIPLGTMNRLAKDLGIPAEPEAAAMALLDGERRRVDVGEVNGHVFLRSSVLGFPSRLAARREDLRGRVTAGDRRRLFLVFLRELYRYPAIPLRLRFAGERRNLRARFVVIANNAFAEGWGLVMAKGRLDRGELVIYHLPRARFWTFLSLAARMLLGRWRGMAGLEAVSVRSVVVATPRRRHVRVMNDGEPLLLPAPLRYRVRPGALEVVVPRAGSPAGDAASEPGTVGDPGAGGPAAAPEPVAA